MKMKRITNHQIVTILLTLLTITVNILANALPLNGQGTGEISDRFAIYFVPAGYVFSIWGLIYLGLIAFAIYQALPAQRDNELLRGIYPAYWIGSIANAAWIYLWHYEFFPLTLVAMFTILATLLVIYWHLSEKRSSLDRQQKWFLKFPFSVYLGWISVATIANISQVLYSINWGGWGISPVIWAVIMIAVASVLGLLMSWLEQDKLYVLVLIWAFVGIAYSQDAALVVNSAWFASAILFLAAVIAPFLKQGVEKGP
jgi:hypothetical protein